MEEMTTGLCPNCGHALQIPAELESFSCMYCGERLTKRQLLTQALRRSVRMKTVLQAMTAPWRGWAGA